MKLPKPARALLVVTLALSVAAPSAAHAANSTYWNSVAALTCLYTTGFNGQVVHNGEKRKGNYAQWRDTAASNISSNLGIGWRVGVKYADGTQQWTGMSGTGDRIHVNTFQSSFSDPFIKNVSGGSRSASGCYTY